MKLDELLFQFHKGCARAALIRRGLREARDVRVVAQEVCYGATKRARAVTMHDAHAAHAV